MEELKKDVWVLLVKLDNEPLFDVEQALLDDVLDLATEGYDLDGPSQLNRISPMVLLTLKNALENIRDLHIKIKSMR